MQIFVRVMAFYAVSKGRQVGIFKTWPECETQVKGFVGAIFKKFSTEQEAITFVGLKGKRQAPIRQLSPKSSFVKKAKFIESPIAVTKTCKHGAYTFEIDNEGYIQVYTDGSCEGNGMGEKACAGFGVYFGQDHPLNASEPVSGRPTNNCGEIQATTYAIKIAKTHSIVRLAINTDSKFVIDAVTKWIGGWKRKNWLLANGKPVKNKIDFSALDKELQDGKVLVKWNHVRGHSGILGNEQADLLARKGSEIFRQIKLLTADECFSD